MVLRLLYCFKDVLIQPFMANRSVVTLELGVLLGFAWLDIFDGDAAFLGPLHQQTTDIFRPVVHANPLRFAAPFDDLVQAAEETHSGQREVDLDPKHFKTVDIQYVEDSELTTIFGPVTALFRFSNLVFRPKREKTWHHHNAPSSSTLKRVASL